MKNNSEKNTFASENVEILKEYAYNFFQVVEPLRGGGGKTPITTKQKTTFFLWLNKKITRTSWNKRTMNKKELHVIFSAGLYRSTEKVSEILYSKI